MAKVRLLADDEEAAALNPPVTEQMPAQVQAVAEGTDIGDKALAVLVLNGAAETDDRSLHALPRIGIVEVHGLGKVRQPDITSTLDVRQNFLGSGLVVIFEVIVDHITLTLALHREMLRTQAVVDVDVLVTIDAAVSRIVVVNPRLEELVEDEGVQVIGPGLHTA